MFKARSRVNYINGGFSFNLCFAVVANGGRETCDPAKLVLM